ncbi:glycosyltransferase [uncultured Desulfovibrio sp.]|uniref:glycosyltransferase family 2 protein n=1 Tax=uncultured Desulfovibrio sp. TaxID=167968 RepID=UPI0025E52C69|nr:glycosyltransferase [uncultured Desulfovibrio sp.]
MSHPFVSVLVSSYNYARYLPAALDSVLAQTWPHLELIVVDDGSADHSLDIARAAALRDGRVRVLTHADGGNHGLAATTRLGLAQCRGDYVAFLESDDVWHADCLRERLETVARTGADVVLNDIFPLFMPGAAEGWYVGYVPRVMRWHAARSRDGREAYTAHAAFLLENRIPTLSCAMLAAPLLRTLSLQPPVPVWFDWWLWTQAAAQARFAYVPRALTGWRQHAASLHRVITPAAYLADYARMGRAMRRVHLRPLLRRGHPGWAIFLCLPSVLRIGARLALPLFRFGPRRTLSMLRERLRPARRRPEASPLPLSPGHKAGSRQI